MCIPLDTVLASDARTDGRATMKRPREKWNSIVTKRLDTNWDRMLVSPEARYDWCQLLSANVLSTPVKPRYKYCENLSRLDRK